MSVKFRDRIKELRRVPANTLKLNAKNWREHGDDQREAFQDIATQIGIADAAIARELEDGSLELIDGHMRTETLGDQEIPVLVLDVDEAEADTLLATMDPLAALADLNRSKLSGLLSGLTVEADSIKMMLNDLAGDNGLFAVNYTPDATSQVVTQEQVDAHTEVLANQMAKPPAELHEITCPHCGEDFKIDPN